VISEEFLLWSQLLLLGSIAAYGVTADPLHGETVRFPWISWSLLLALRALLVAVLAFGLSFSVILSTLLLFLTLAQPLFRYLLPMRWLAEFESFWIFVSMFSTLAVLR